MIAAMAVATFQCRNIVSRSLLAHAEATVPVAVDGACRPPFPSRSWRCCATLARIPLARAYNQPLPDASLVACPDCDLLQRLPGAGAGRVGALPALRPGAVAPPRGFAQPDAGAGARGGGALRRSPTAVPMLGLDAVGHAGLHHGGRRRAAALARRAGGRRRAGALHRRRRAGAADRLHAGDRARRPSRRPRRAGSGTLLRHHPTTAHVEHDRGHDGRRAGRADQDRRLRDA